MKTPTQAPAQAVTVPVSRPYSQRTLNSIRGHKRYVITAKSLGLTPNKTTK